MSKSKKPAREQEQEYGRAHGRHPKRASRDDRKGKQTGKEGLETGSAKEDREEQGMQQGETLAGAERRRQDGSGFKVQEEGREEGKNGEEQSKGGTRDGEKYKAQKDGMTELVLYILSVGRLRPSKKS